jgi:alpha-1,2-mannosyltransferase
MHGSAAETKWRDRTGPSDRDSLAQLWFQLALTLWIALGLAHAVKTLSDPHVHSVYPIFHEAGRAWTQGRSIYHDLDGGKNEFFYSPAFAVALAPLSMLPLPIAAVMWSWLSLGLMFGSLRSLYRETVGKHWPQFVEGQFLLLCGATAIQGGWSAQSNSLVLAGIVYGATSLLRGNYWRAAFCLAAPVHIKVWPVVAGVLFSIRYWRTFSWRMAAAVCVVGALPFLTATPQKVVQSYETWGDKLAHREETNKRYGGYRDSWTVLEETLGAPDLSFYKVLQVASGGLVFCWCLSNAMRGFTPERWLFSTLSWWSIWQLLFGPGTERLTYGILAPAVAYAVLESSTVKRWQLVAWTAWLMTGILGTGEAEQAIAKIWPAAPIMTPLGVMILALWQIQHEASPHFTWSCPAEPRTPLTEEESPLRRHRRAA